MAQDRNAGTPVDSLEAFRSLVLEKFRQKLREDEKQAIQAGSAVTGEFVVGAERIAEPLLRIRYVCEPGRAARVVAVDGPKDCSALFDDEGQSGPLH